MSQFIVSARKYRPLRFDEVVGQAHVTDTLKNALKSDHLAHAFLFTGPRGVGKTSCARILAKAINCENPSEEKEPCNTCGSCESFNENASFNILELDAASNNTVDHIRTLNEQVRFQPQQGQYKVFIIDEVHMLSASAFNAFLKTLEEPPPYAIFILATTEKHKILPTILSRCQVFDFHRIQLSAMTAHLRSIAEKENIEADEDALMLIATKADGALRDALSIFDRLSNASDRKLDYASVIDQLNILDYDYYFKFVDACLSEDLDAVMNLYNEVSSRGFEGDMFLMGISEHLRNLMVAKSPQTKNLLEASAQLQNRYADQAQKTDLGFLLTGLSLANHHDIHYPRAKNKRLHVEIFLAKLCFMKRASLPTQEGAEKKKVELKPQKQPAKTIEVKQTETKAEAKQEDPKVDQDPLPEEDVHVSEKPTERPKIKKSIPSLIPKITSIDVLMEKVLKEENTPVEVDELTEAIFLEEWKKESGKIDSPSIRKVFDVAEVQLVGDDIQVKVTSNVAKETIIQQSAFVQKIRDKYRRPKLNFDISIDEEKARIIMEQNQKPLSYQDKYAELVQSNPKVAELQKRFQLKPDNE